MSSLPPRVVLLSRRTEFDHLMARHGTRGQIEFFLESREQNLEEIEARHNLQVSTLKKARQLIPADWSVAEIQRQDLDRFLFTPNDLIVAVGQDGLVANLAKYLDGQPVIGLSPDLKSGEAILTASTIKDLSGLYRDVFKRKVKIQNRTMVEARLDDGQTLSALNEIFIGHQSHQSAKYLIRHGKTEEYQSSSGVIVASGTGITGWAKSILRATKRKAQLQPDDGEALFFTREPWPSRNSQVGLNFGHVSERHKLTLTSRMNERGTIFADGIETDFLKFDWGTKVRIGISKRTLNLVSG